MKQIGIQTYSDSLQDIKMQQALSLCHDLKMNEMLTSAQGFAAAKSVSRSSRPKLRKDQFDEKQDMEQCEMYLEQGIAEGNPGISV